MDYHAMLDDYLTVRRALGVKLGREEKLLKQFLAWLAEHGQARITADATVAWVRQPGEVTAGWLGMRMRAVRGFADQRIGGAKSAHGYCLDYTRRLLPQVMSRKMGRKESGREPTNVCRGDIMLALKPSIRRLLCRNM